MPRDTLSQFLLVIALKALSNEIKEGLPWEMLYADDLVLVADSLDLLREKVVEWRNCLEGTGLKMNVSKSKMMVSDRKLESVEKYGKWPCAVCGKGVGRNSIQCTKCCNWVHKRCSGVKQMLKTVEDEFACKVCSIGNEKRDDSLDIELVLENGDCIENVNKFCYLGDMINSGGGVDSASTMRMRCAWAKF